MLHNNALRGPPRGSFAATTAVDWRRTHGAELGIDRGCVVEEAILRRIALRNVSTCPEPPASNEEDRAVGIHRQVTNFVSELSFSPDGVLLVANAGENLHIFDPNRGHVVRNLWRPHENTDITNLAFYTDRKFYYSTTNGCIGFWDIRKLDRPLNFFKAYSNPISKLLYDKNTEWLLSANQQEGMLNYWYLPAFEREGVDIEENHHGRLTSCPMLNQMCFIEDRFSKKLVLYSSTSNSLYIIDNLNLIEFATEEKYKKLIFSENFKMYLGMNPKMADKSSKNHLWYLDYDEFEPLPGAMITGISHMEGFPNSLVVLMRLTTKDHTLRTFGHNSRDWTVCVRLKDRPHPSCNIFLPYGSNIVDECLLYSQEEPRYCPLRSKSICFSPCCRIIASPQRSAIKLSTFSVGFSDIHEATHSHLKKKDSSLLSIFSATSKPREFHEYSLLDFDSSIKSFPLCCKFSPIIGLLAVGDSAGRVSFYQPRL